MTKENYYAVRIGQPGKHAPYFMLREGASTPQLFHTEEDAKEAASNAPYRKAVRVELRETKIDS